MRPTFLPKVHAATKLATQVRIPPPAPQAPHCTDRGAPRTPRAQEGHPLPRRLTRPRRPLPLYGTFSTEDWALAVAKEAERHAAEVADGAAGGLDLCGCAGHRGQRPPDRCPLNRWSSSSGDRKDAVWEGSPGSAFSTPSCRHEHGLGTRVSDMQDRYLTRQCWRVHSGGAQLGKHLVSEEFAAVGQQLRVGIS